MADSNRAGNEPLGVAIIGSGTIGRVRALLARDHPSVGWLGVCDVDESRARAVAEEARADFYTTDSDALLARSEVTATVIATDEANHANPTLAAVEAGHALLIEKPLATDVHQSLEVHQAIQESGVDAVMGYTQRFRRRFLTVKQRLADGQVGEIDSVTTRALLNRMTPEAGLSRMAPAQREGWTPMVISGTHAVDLSMWLLEGRKPVEVYARSADKILGEHGLVNTTFGIVTMDDGAIWSMNLCVGMPVVWPGAVYGLDVAIVGTKGALTVDDSHRDIVLASEYAQHAGYKPAEGFQPPSPRHVEFLTSYPPGDEAYGAIWGPMREETNSWIARVAGGVQTPHAPASDGHRNAVLTMAFDLSARLGEPVPWPIDLDRLTAP